MDINDKTLEQEFQKHSNIQNRTGQGFQSNVTKIVTKSSNLAEKSQKNLLSLYLTEEGMINKQMLSEAIKEVDYSDENLENIKETIDKILFSVNNINDLIKSLYTQFDEDNEKKEIITHTKNKTTFQKILIMI